MSIIETNVSAWSNKQLKFKPNTYPQSVNGCLPRNYFVGVAVGSRGSGKTYSICKLVKEYENSKFDGGQDMRVILFSPTHDANPVFNCLKSLDKDDVINNYSDDKLIEVIQDIKNEKADTQRYKEELLIYQKFMHGKIDKMTHEEVSILEKIDYSKSVECRFIHGVINFLIFDDLVGSSA